ncbi:MAG TPA: TIGR03435 family protein [Acidobacteriaceae bacterium]|nr:TIGR03435 family protein [Acidobacteriaceae bacterium]
MKARWIRWAVFGIAGLMCAAPKSRAQDAAASAAAKPTMMAKDADPDWEVVTVKPGDPNDKRDRIDMNGRHAIVENEPVELILRFAYGVEKNQIAGLPDWAKTEIWSVDGVPNVEGKPAPEQFRALMRKLLAERFGVQLHHEQREMTVLALTVAKGGPKLEKSALDPSAPLSHKGSGSGGLEVHQFTNWSMTDLIPMLMLYTNRPVVDQTGLKGKYDFKLQWTRDDAPATAAATPDAPPGLFTAIQEQIGLKLEPTKAMADVLVIDRVERPGAN